MKHERKIATEIALQAGELVMRYFRAGIPVEQKSDASPVTAADREAESLIKERIAKEFPNDSIVGEEFGLSGATSERTWYIDPIDGTRSFIHGVPLFAVLIGLSIRDESVLGVANFPSTRELFIASSGGGAFCNDRQIHVNETKTMSESLVVCGSISSFSKSDRLQGLLRLTESAGSVRHWGDAYGHCMVASGRASAMVDPIVADWDTCAVSCIVREAGGMATDFRGTSGFRGGELISCNSHIHAEVLRLFES